MKKYLLGVFAIALAVGFSAFAPKFTNVKMKFTGSATQLDRETEGLYALDNNVSCTAEDNVCAIVIDDSHIESTGVFKSYVTISSPNPDGQVVVRDNRDNSLISSTTQFKQ